jgi:hypothetical protein
MAAQTVTPANTEHRPLTHGLTADITGNTVVLGGNTYPAKDAIKAAGFRWINRTWRGTPAALTKLEATLADTKGYTITAPKFPPTPEQNRILAAVATGRDVVIQAGAGAGKTSTLELIAAAHPAPILLIVFGKDAQLDAAARMPRHVEARTFDSLGFAGAPRDMVDKFRAQRDAAWKSPQAPVRKLVEVGAYLGLDTDPVEVTVELTQILDGKTVTRKETAALTPARAASAALRMIEKWCTTADPEITARHASDEGPQVAEAIVPVARRVWEDILSPTGRIRVTNGHLTKMWALGAPDLTRPGTGPRKPPTMILVDEAQDTSPVVEAVMMAQTVQMVAVGDSAQAIYGWRGAVDFLAHIDVPDDCRLPLTQSWRFGPEIAAVGNAFLALLHNPFFVEGAGKPGRVLSPDTMYRPDAVLCRTNAGMLGEIQDLLKDQAKVAVPKGTRTDLDVLAQTVRWLMGGPTPSRVHDDLAAFGTWDEVGKAIGQGEADPKAEKIHDLVTSIGVDGVEQIVAEIREIGEPGINDGRSHYTVVTTAHKSKGAQWPRVKIGWDFPAPRQTKQGDWWEPGPEELKLAYVAVTRAQTELDPGSLSWALKK